MKIALAGTHGTGKTTIIDELKPLNVIREVSRKAIKKFGMNPQNMSPEQLDCFQKYIFWKQIAEETRKDDFFSDRSLYDILAYSQNIP